MRTTTRLAMLGFLLAPLVPMTARAQGPTAENTVITNTATATWTDANNNTYTPVQASVSVTVGFLVGVDVTSPASVTPASPSTGNAVAFTISNIGNGTDSIRVTPTIPAGLTATGYRVDGTTYLTLADLNLALSQRPVAAAGNVVVEILYTVAPGLGGQTLPVTLSATSRRDGVTATGTDASTTNVIPTIARGVAVTPDGGTRDRLPSNATQYSEIFTVTNNGNATDTYSLAASTAGTGTVTIVSVQGNAGTTGSLSLAAGGSNTVTVVYTVANAAAGATEPLRLTATSTNDALITDPGEVTIRVVRAQLSISKEVFRDNRTSVIAAADRVLPGEYIQYRITVTNAGGADASAVRVDDALVASLQYDTSSGDLAGWSFSALGAGVRADLTGALAPGASRFFWVRARVR